MAAKREAEERAKKQAAEKAAAEEKTKEAAAKAKEELEHAKSAAEKKKQRQGKVNRESKRNRLAEWLRSNVGKLLRSWKQHVLRNSVKWKNSRIIKELRPQVKPNRTIPRTVN
jgi:hypothetical protein